MENRKKIFRVNRKVVLFFHRLMLIVMLHATIVAPSQTMINDRFNPTKATAYFGSNYASNENNNLAKTTTSIINPMLLAKNYKNKAISIPINQVKKNGFFNNYVINSDIKEGVIGISKENPLDDATDNLFKFSISELPTGLKAYVSYELNGINDNSGVAKSINDRQATGGYLVKQQRGWTTQKEEINVNWLRMGENKILFSIPKGADYEYRVRNVTIEFEEIAPNAVLPQLVVNNSEINLAKDNQVYIRGFIRNFKTDVKVVAENNSLKVTDGTFEGFIKLTDEIKNRHFIVVKAQDAEGFLGQEIISLNTLLEADKVYPIETISDKATSFFKANTHGKLSNAYASVIINNEALLVDKEITIVQLRAIDIPPMSSGMINVTKGGAAYRFLPDGTKFNKPVKIELGYDEKLIPTGYTPNDIKTFYFNTDSKSWVAVKRDSIREKDKMITASTNHFTDYINGIIQTPESPQTAGFTPTMMNDIKAADPSAEMTIISPPEVSQKGDANVSYPIKIPAGRKGMQPQIAVQYSNEGGNGWLGQGWNLTTPSIGIETQWGTPIFDQEHETEIYTMNGEQLMYPKLINTSGNKVDWMPNRHYDDSGTTTMYNTAPRSRIDPSKALFTPRKQGSFAKIERLGTSPATYYWKVTNSDGTINWYGGKDAVVSNAVIKDNNNNIVHWGLFMTEDVYGNNIVYRYKNINLTGSSVAGTNLNNGNVFHIDFINYTGFNDIIGKYWIQFVDEDQIIRQDINITARLGVKQIQPYRLKTINVGLDRRIIRYYQLNYNTGKFGKSLLSDVAEWSGYIIGHADPNNPPKEFYKHTFKYYDDIFEKQPLFQPPVTIQVPDFSSDFILDFGNALDASRLNASESTEPSWEAKPFFGFELLVPTFNNYRNLVFGLPFGESYPKNKGKITMTDMDGNGLDDVLYRDKNHNLYYFPHYINTAGTHYFDSAYKQVVNINNFSRTKGTTKTMFGESYDVTCFGFSLGHKRFKTQETTDIYLTDGNGDGLPDIVDGQTVYFNKGLDPTVGSNTFVTGSELTPNMVITAQPSTLDANNVPDPEPSDTQFDTNYDVVRVWEAPYQGSIVIRDNLQYYPQSATSKVVYSIETKTDKIENTSTPFRLYLKQFDQNNTTDNIYLTQSSSSVPLGISYSRIFVNKGQKVYFRLHKNKIGQNDILNTNPTITYVQFDDFSNSSNATYFDQNINDRREYNYKNDFVLSSQNEINIPASGNVFINWVPIVVSNPSDNVNFKIVKEVQSSTGATDTTILDVNCPMGTTTTITNASLTPNYGSISPINSGEKFVFKFLITSDSNVKWKDIVWKPYLKYIPDATAIAQGVTQDFIKYCIPKYSVYQEFGFSDFTLRSNNNAYNNWQIPNGSHQYSVLPNITTYSGAPQMLLTDEGEFMFVVKKNGVTLGKRKIKVHLGIISFEGNATPIPFYTGVVSATSPPTISCQFYVDVAANNKNIEVYNRYLKAVSYSYSYTQYLNNLNCVGGNVLVGFDDEFNSTSYSTNSPAHFWRFGVDAFTNQNEHLGSMNRSWGQFLYNDTLDNSSMPSDNYSKLINDAIIDNPATSMLNAISNIFGIDVSGCNNTNDPNAAADCVQNTITSHFNIPNPSTPINNSNLSSTISSFMASGNFNPSALLSSLVFMSMSATRYFDSNHTEVSKWTGLFDSQYSSPSEMKDGNMSDSQLGMVFNDPDNNDSPLLISNQNTGMYAIDKVQHSVAVSEQAGWGSYQYSQSDSHYSNTDSDFIDLNGDRYPDILVSNDIQTTTMTGGHRPPSGDYGLNPLNGNDNTNSAISARGTYPTAGRKKQLEKQSDNGRPDFSQGLGVNLNLDGINKEKESIIDLNGDGLPDRIIRDSNGQFVYKLNRGNSFTSNNFEPFDQFESIESKPEALNCNPNFALSSIPTSNLPFSISAGFSKSGGNTNVSFQDMNGDGLVDLLKFNGGSATVQYNLGNRFSDTPVALSYDLLHNNTNTSASLSGEITPYVGHSIAFAIIIPFCCFLPVVYFKYGVTVGGSANLTISESNKEFKDFNGDGYADYLERDGKNIKVYYSNIGRTNMLQTVSNPLGGNFTVDYTAQPVNFNNPNAKWVMKTVVSNDGYNKDQDGADISIKGFTYENGKYDRREREFYGYETVKTIDYNLDLSGNISSIYRTSVSSYHNQSYFLNGLLKESYVIKGNDPNKKFSRTLHTYEVRQLDTNDNNLMTATVLPNTFDVGGTEGRRTAAVVQTKTTNELYELASSPQLVSTVEMTYDNKGRVVVYNDKGNLSTTADDYSSTVTYQTLNNNILIVPKDIIVSKGSQELRHRTTDANPDTGVITSIKAYLDSTNYSETNMEYDQYGNLTFIEYPENDTNQRMFYKYSYDDSYSLNKYVTSITDAFGYSSFADYDGRFDKILSTTDMAGNQMQYQYDRFGRTTIILAPKEIEAGKEYTIKFDYYPFYGDLPSGTLPQSDFVPVARTKHFDWQRPDNDIETYTFMDGLARPIQIKKDIQYNKDASHLNPDYYEALSISGITTYDQFGRVIEQRHPFFEPKSSTTCFLFNDHPINIFSQTKYDELDRPVLNIDPAGNTSNMQYSIAASNNGQMAIKTRSNVDQNGTQEIITETYKDVRGKVIATKNVGPTGDLWTSFDYDAIGELKGYLDADNLITKCDYDNFGRKIKVTHPDNGATTFNYDKASNLTKLQTANLANSGGIINYEYNFNRLEHIVYPPDPSGSLNVANVDYKYGDAGNKTGRLIFQKDATGTQEFDYGNMGEMIYNKRTIVGPTPNMPVRVFETSFDYDSFNRTKAMRYPDGEEVTYTYDYGGNLFSMTGQVNNQSYRYIKRLDYDEYEQRTYLLYGNKTNTFYTYDAQLRRLQNLNVKTSDSHDLYNNTYDYDNVGNVTSIVNSAGITGNTMAGNYGHYFTYDDLNRLHSAKGDFAGSPTQANFGNDFSAQYHLDMEYNNTHGILSKTQNHDKNGSTFAPNTYNNHYEYINGTHQLKTVTDISGSGNVDTYQYDANGNIISKQDTQGNERDNYWDESNRLRVVDDNCGALQHYIYDASGERVLKASSDQEAVYENGTLVDPGSITMNTYTTYPSAFLVINEHGVYSKHYYAGSQRIVSRIGDQDSDIFSCHDCTRRTTDATVDYKQLQQNQVADLNAILKKAKRGKAQFKDYKAYKLEDLEKAIADEDSDTDRPATAAALAPLAPLYFYHPDHLGTSTALTDFNGNAYQFFLNLPFGETMAEQHGTQYYQTSYKFNGKELDEETGLYYYGARYYDPKVSIWYSVDPLAEKFPEWSPYAFCYNNPLRFVDLDGRKGDDWVERKGKIVWDEKVTSATDKDLQKGDRYLGKSVVVFNGSRNEKLGKGNSLFGKGAVLANVTVYGPKGENDIKEYKGFSMSSDFNKFGAIDDGEYTVSYRNPGKRGSLKSNWAINNTGLVDCLDGKNPNPDGASATQKSGVYIHRSNNDGNAYPAGHPCSTGCPLIVPSGHGQNGWNEFNQQLEGVKEFHLIMTGRKK